MYPVCCLYSTQTLHNILSLCLNFCIHLRTQSTQTGFKSKKIGIGWSWLNEYIYKDDYYIAKWFHVSLSRVFIRINYSSYGGQDQKHFFANLSSYTLHLTQTKNQNHRFKRS